MSARPSTPCAKVSPARIVNGYGVYSDVSTQRAILRETRDCLTAALAVMERTAWPTEADYGQR